MIILADFLLSQIRLQIWTSVLMIMEAVSIFVGTQSGHTNARVTTASLYMKTNTTVKKV